MLSAALLLLTIKLLAINPHELLVRERVDLVEVNHFYDEQGRLVFDQVIFYDWSPEHSRYMVRAWRMVKSPTQLPEPDWIGGGARFPVDRRRSLAARARPELSRDVDAVRPGACRARVSAARAAARAASYATGICARPVSP